MAVREANEPLQILFIPVILTIGKLVTVTTQFAVSDPQLDPVTDPIMVVTPTNALFHVNNPVEIFIVPAEPALNK